MPKRTDILATLPGTPPIALNEQESAALCGMSVAAFKALCPMLGAKRGRGIYYPYDEVKAWFRLWWLAQTDQDDNDPGDWLEMFDDDKDAA